MTELQTEAPELPDPPRLTWRCPICKQRLVLRSSTEDEARFRARCATHQRGAKSCQANVLAAQLMNSGMVSLRHGNEFVEGYSVLNQAGLVTQQMTHVVEATAVKNARSRRRRRVLKRSAEYAALPDPVIPAPWAPSWAVRYERYLRVTRRRSIEVRIAELTDAAANPERAQAFLALMGNENEG